jgi:hypothetical protein
MKKTMRDGEKKRNGAEKALVKYHKIAVVKEFAISFFSYSVQSLSKPLLL